MSGGPVDKIAVAHIATDRPPDESVALDRDYGWQRDNRIELLENGEKPGLRGRVLDVNLIYTTLQETDGQAAGTVLQIPNSLFFQRTLRRWPSGVVPQVVEHIPGP